MLESLGRLPVDEVGNLCPEGAVGDRRFDEDFTRCTELHGIFYEFIGEIADIVPYFLVEAARCPVAQCYELGDEIRRHRAVFPAQVERTVEQAKRGHVIAVADREVCQSI
jgi:hypothetical protein